MCTRDKQYQHPNGMQPVTNVSVYKRSLGFGLNSNSSTIRSRSLWSPCRKYDKYPSFAPQIISVYPSTCVAGIYTVVQITGSNFLPPCYGTTYVNLGNFQNLPITFYSNVNISFAVPLNAPAGDYNLTVVNIYNGQFSPEVNQSYAGAQNVSNSVTYTIT